MNASNAQTPKAESDAICPRCQGREWQPAHVTLDNTGRVLGLAYPLTCIACGTVRTMPVGGYPAVIANEVNRSLRERIQDAERTAPVLRFPPGMPRAES